MDSEIDLHGLLVTEAIDAFIEYYNDRVRAGYYGRILVIHGYGSSGEGGKIRSRLRSFLATHDAYLTFEYGEHLGGGNLGSTFVFPRKPLPSPLDTLSNEILDYCRIPKTKSKIAGKFRIAGDVKIQACLQNLEKRKLLAVTHKGGYKIYSTI